MLQKSVCFFVAQEEELQLQVGLCPLILPAAQFQDLRMFGCCFKKKMANAAAMMQAAKSIGPLQARFMQWLLRDEMVSRSVFMIQIHFKEMCDVHLRVCLLNMQADTTAIITSSHSAYTVDLCLL
jgi:ABC-type transport system involved in cytochrome bd biosynthesis fused ATPase/permease subunit